MTPTQLVKTVRKVIRETLSEGLKAAADMQRLTFTCAETAKKLGRSPRTIARMIERGDLHPVRVAGKRMISARELERICTPGIEKRRSSRAHRTAVTGRAAKREIDAFLREEAAR